MRREVTIGQFLDIAEESAYVSEPDERHAERALRVASLKSARYSIQQPLAIGAALAGRGCRSAGGAAAFGHPVGMAFQLRDDVLGVFGDEAATGKPSGDDLREGKRTVLIAYARERLAPPARRIVDELIGDSESGSAQIASLQRTIIETGRARARRAAHRRLLARGRALALRGATGQRRRRRAARPGARRDRAHDLSGHVATAASWRQPSDCATRRTSLLRPARSASIGGMPIDSSEREQPVDRLVVGEARVVEHEEGAAQRSDRLPSTMNTAGTLNDAVAAGADELELVEQPSNTPERFAEHLGQVGEREPFGFDLGRGVSGHEATISLLRRLLGKSPSARGMRASQFTSVTHESLL